MILTNFIGGFAVLFFGILVKYFKATSLIAGYNTASAEEKAKYDVDKLVKFVGNMLIISSVFLLIGGLIYFITGTSLYVFFISWALFALVIIGGVIYMYTGNHLKKN